jgi:hypothetical protein
MTLPATIIITTIIITTASGEWPEARSSGFGVPTGRPYGWTMRRPARRP